MGQRWAVAAGVLALSATLAACTPGTDLEAVRKTCGGAVDRAIATAAGDYTSSDFLALDHDELRVSSPVRGQLGTAITGLAVGCIMKETQAPAWVEARLREGRVRDGRHEVTWSDVTMSYRFLREKGLRAVVRRT